MKDLCPAICLLCCLLVGCGAETEQISELTFPAETTTGIPAAETNPAETTTAETVSETAENTTAATQSSSVISPYARTIPPVVTTASGNSQQTASRSTAQASDNQVQQPAQNREAELAAARAEKDRLADEAAAAQTNADAAAQRLAAAQDARNAAVQQRDQYQNAHRQQLDQFSLGAFGFFAYVGADSALDVLNNAPYASFTVRGAENDATSLTNIKNSFAWMRECNRLRASEGLAPLRVTDRLMAIAESDLNWSDGNIDHSRQFNVGENLSWNYSDPFTGWYDDEKASRGGHYLNIINSGYALTGFAVCTAGRSGRFSVSHGQVFDYSANEASYSVDEYEARFDAYYNDTIAVQQQMTALQQQAENAENEFNARNAALNDANAVLAQKQQALQAVEERCARLQ